MYIVVDSASDYKIGCTYTCSRMSTATSFASGNGDPEETETSKTKQEPELNGTLSRFTRKEFAFTVIIYEIERK